MTNADQTAWQDHWRRGTVDPVLHPWAYEYDERKDLYTDKKDKHSFYAGRDVREAQQLADKLNKQKVA